MSIALNSPVTGAAQTGFTSPTYTIASDTAPDVNGKAYAVTALGGTQAGVTVHSVSSPFSITFWRPKILRGVGRLNANGQLVANPKNTYSFIVRKGVTPMANQAAEIALFKGEISVPAGSDSYDAANVRALFSAAIGALNQISAGFGDTATDGRL